MLEAVGDGRDDGRTNEADNDENAACNAGVCLGETVWFENLVQEGGDAVEEADVDGEGDQDEPEFEGFKELNQRRTEGCFTAC